MKTYDEVFRNVMEATSAHRQKVKRIQSAVSASVICAVCVVGASMYMRLEKPESVPPGEETTTTTVPADVSPEPDGSVHDSKTDPDEETVFDYISSSGNYYADPTELHYDSTESSVNRDDPESGTTSGNSQEDDSEIFENSENPGDPGNPENPDHPGSTGASVQTSVQTVTQTTGVTGSGTNPGSESNSAVSETMTETKSETKSEQTTEICEPTESDDMPETSQTETQIFWASETASPEEPDDPEESADPTEADPTETLAVTTAETAETLGLTTDVAETTAVSQDASPEFGSETTSETTTTSTTTTEPELAELAENLKYSPDSDQTWTEIIY